VKAGATVVAPRVKGSPSLADKGACSELRTLAAALWGSDVAPHGAHAFGKGRIYWGTPLQAVLAAVHVDPDFTFDPPKNVTPYDYPSPKTSAEVVWNHRQVEDKDIYFVANQRMRTEDLVVHFRVAGKSAELWHSDTGMIEPAVSANDGNKSMLNLHLTPEESVFVVFRKGRTSGQPARTQATEELLPITNPWKVSFPPNLGAPFEIELNSLSSWTTSVDQGVKYFSGTATYTNHFTLPDQWERSHSKVVLDLGRVREFAQVRLNDKALPDILWKPPFSVEVTSNLKSGVNTVEIQVTNLWPNRIIGDQQPEAKQRFTFTVYGAYQADSPLVESGLLGPVKLMASKK
jgi:hypothetical protein